MQLVTISVILGLCHLNKMTVLWILASPLPSGIYFKQNQIISFYWTKVTLIFTVYSLFVDLLEELDQELENDPAVQEMLQCSRPGGTGRVGRVQARPKIGDRV